MARYLKFWGTRGSCPVSGPNYQQFGGNTACLELRYDDVLIIFDAGTGIRPLGESLKSEKEIDLFIGHTHWDHTIGFPFFHPIYEKGIKITVWAPHGNGRTTKERFEDIFSPEFFPIHLDEIQADLAFKTLREKAPVQIGPITLDFHPTRHPGNAFCFKIKTPHQTIGYVTDNEIDLPSQKSFIDFHENADIFIHEAQYFVEEYEKKKGWGHSSIQAFIALLEKISPKQCFITHHDPQHTDADLRHLAMIAHAVTEEKGLPCSPQWVPDGFILNLQ
jgi:phosphoribosyl 1,2-cyclic phosphodiesterase